MSIKTTLGQLVTANESNALGNVSGLLPPGSYHFRVAKLIDAVDRELRDYTKQRNVLIKKYGVPVLVEKDGQQVPNGDITLKGASIDNTLAFNTALGELLALEVTIPYEPIIWAKLGLDKPAEGPCPHCGKPVKTTPNLSINDVRLLGPLLVEDETALNPAPEPLKAV
jgi:hypothetical protein